MITALPKYATGARVLITTRLKDNKTNAPPNPLPTAVRAHFFDSGKVSVGSQIMTADGVSTDGTEELYSTTYLVPDDAKNEVYYVGLEYTFADETTDRSPLVPTFQVIPEPPVTQPN